MKWALLCVVALSGCTDFAALEAEVCAKRPWVCVDGGVSPYCRSCTRSSECGGPMNFCLTTAAQGPRCGIDCSIDGCPYGSECIGVMSPDGGGQIGSNCRPINCDGG